MANKVFTVFQKLDKAISGNWDANNQQPMNHTNNYDMSHSKVIYQTNDKSDYNKTKLELQQNNYLNNRWKKANVELAVTAFSGLNNVKLMYRDADLMDSFPEIGAALDIVSEESCVTSDKGKIINVYSKSDRIKNIVEDLLINRLDLHVTAPMVIRAMCKYGNQFMLLNIDNKLGVTGWRQLPVFEVERIENGIINPYNGAIGISNTDNIDNSTKFLWTGEQSSQMPFRNWQIGHFRLLTDSLYLPYGCLVGDTKIETEYGYKEIKDIAIGDKIWTFNVDKQEKELSTATMMQFKGIKEVYHIETKHNFIDGTDDHKLLTYYDNKLDYKEIKDLNVGDLLIIPNPNENYKEIEIDKTKLPSSRNRGIKAFDNNVDNLPNFVDEKFAKFFGFMIGDGWINENCISIAVGTQGSINKEMSDLLNEYTNNKITWHKRIDENSKCEWLSFSSSSKFLSTIMYRMGFIDGATKKRIPQWVYEAKPSIKKAFLNGLMLADGSYFIDGRKKNSSIRCDIELCNEYLIKDVKVLCQDLNYKTSQIHCRLRKEHYSQIANKVMYFKNNSYHLSYYETDIKQYKNNDFSNRVNDNFICEKITKKILKGSEKTYDITVENNNSNFIANGIVTHNCSYLNKARRHWRMLSLMEDMMLIYRLERSIERRVYKIFVGAIDDADVQAYVEEIANNFKRTPIVDPMTGQVDLRKNLLPVRKDTPIPLLDGRTITIEDLAKEYEDGKINYVYSVQDKTKQIVPGKVVWCGKNYTAEELVKITLDDGSYTVMAKEHEVVMRDGSKKRADELIPNESVMPFYTKCDKNSKNYHECYEKIYNPNNSKYEFTHKLIGKHNIKENLYYDTIHHLDFNKYNNAPSNLLWCEYHEHHKMHSDIITKYNKSQEGINERIIRGKALGYRDDFKAYNESELHTKHNSIRKEATKKSWVGNGRTNRIEKMNIHFDNLIWDSLRENVLNKNIVNRKTMLEYINSNLIEHLMSINCNRRLNNNGFISREVLENRIKDNGFNTITEYISETLRNHKVAKIEYIGGDDVYCMTVVGNNGEDDRHNFALKTFNEDGSWHENGIFVSNCVDQDIFIPVRDPNAATPIDTLPAAQNLTAMDDIKFIQNKVLTALRIPKTFLNFEDSVGDGKNLALMDIRFTRTINRIQQAFLMELTKIVTIHLYLLGFEDELTDFTLSMNNPSTQSEQLEIDNLQKKILAIRDAVTDPGNGLPIMSQTRALREIMKWSDKEIKENLEEIRLEKGIAAELEKTSQIIKKTGVFDIVDRMYGESGAEYQDDQSSPQDNDGGMPGGGGGGSFGGGLDDMGGIDDGAMDGEISGEEGEIPVEDANADTSSESQTEEPQQSNEKTITKKPLITESKKVKKQIIAKNSNDMFIKNYVKHLDENELKKENKNIIERTEIYNKTLLINEEFNDIIKSIDKFL